MLTFSVHVSLKSDLIEIVTKGQLILKANYQAEDSSKKRMKDFVFTSMRRLFVRFLEESSARNKRFRDYLTFKLGYSWIKIDHIADSLLKDAVLMVGVNLRLCLLSLWFKI